MTRRILWALGLMAVMATISAPAYAQVNGGVRAGISGGPTQFVVGGHVETQEIVDRLTFRPNVELGFGDNQTIVGINLEFAYLLPTKADPWRFYLGAGPAAVVTHVSVAGLSSNDFGGGFNFLGGVHHTSGLFVEMKVGVARSQDFKLMIGWQIKTK